MRDEGDVKISVILSAYNPVRERLLAAVRSITEQTFPDWEMILVDDGSDSSFAPVFAQIAESDPRIRLIRRKENGGLAASLNDAIGAAAGEFLARMDGDDTCDPERLEKQYDFLKENGEYMWVGTGAWLTDESGRWGRRIMSKRPAAEDFLSYSPYIHPSVMFRAEVFERCGGYHVMRRGEDYELFMRLHAMGMQGYNIPEELYSYREDADTYRHRDFQSRLEEVRIRREGFKSLGIHSPKRPFYVIKPIFVACIPNDMQQKIKRTGNETYAE